MADKSAIEWTEATWNPVTGCDRVSEGCDHCYAQTLAKRLKAMGNRRYQRDGDPKTSGPGFGVTLHPDQLALPLRWKQPRVVFVNSMSDLFHDEVPDDFIASAFHTMAMTPQHTYQVLTKRPGRMSSVLRRWEGTELAQLVGLPNVWLGTSVGNPLVPSRRTLLVSEVHRRVGLVSFIEEGFDVTLDHLDMTPENFGTISDINRLVETKLGGRSAPEAAVG